MRRLLLPLLLLVSSAVSCGGDDAVVETTATTASPPTTATTTDAPAPLVEAAELAEVTALVEGVARAHSEAWDRQDVDAILSFYDDGSVHEDSLFGVVLQGEGLYSMPAEFVVEFAGARFAITDAFVNREAALVADRTWGVTLRGVTFTEGAPMLEMDRVEVGEDGLIGRWSLYYGLEMWELWDSPSFRMEPARAVLERYLSAWGGRDPEAVHSLYAESAQRLDSLLGVSVSGPDAIGAAAAEWFAAHPGVVMTAGFDFSDSRKSASDVDMVGSVYELGLSDGCVVRMATLLTVVDDLIEREEVFWDADSLVACGWAA